MIATACARCASSDGRDIAPQPIVAPRDRDPDRGRQLPSVSTCHSDPGGDASQGAHCTDRRAAVPPRSSAETPPPATTNLNSALCSIRRRRSNAATPLVPTPPEHRSTHGSNWTQHVVGNFQSALLGKFRSALIGVKVNCLIVTAASCRSDASGGLECCSRGAGKAGQRKPPVCWATADRTLLNPPRRHCD